MLSDTLEILEEKIDAEEHVIRFTEGLHQSLGAEFIAGLIENPCVSVAESHEEAGDTGWTREISDER